MTQAPARTGPLALIIHTDGRAELRELPTDQAFDQARAIVGGHVTAMLAADWSAYLNEDGHMIPLPRNLFADAIARAAGFHFRHGDYLVGDVVFLGPACDGDVPERVLSLARAAGLPV